MVTGNNKPLYLQCADWIMDNVVGGDFAPDSRVPAVRELAASQQINIGTAQKAYEYLAQHDVVYNKRGMGHYVHPEGAARVVELRTSEFMNHDMEYFFSRIKSIGVTPERLTELYSDYLNL